MEETDRNVWHLKNSGAVASVLGLPSLVVREADHFLLSIPKKKNTGALRVTDVSRSPCSLVALVNLTGSQEDAEIVEELLRIAVNILRAMEYLIVGVLREGKEDYEVAASDRPDLVQVGEPLREVLISYEGVGRGL